MTAFVLRLRWATLSLLAAAVAAVPTPPARAQDKPLSAEERQKRIANLEKQLAELKKQAAKPDPAAAATAAPAAPAGTIPADYLKPFAWRCIGPANMGGRVTALAVIESDPTTYYVGTGTGGLLKTTNNGITFEHLFDKEGVVAIGDVAVARSNPNVVWVGTGEANPRNSVSYGDGVYKSLDGGKTWKHVGLKGTFQVGKVVIHPTNPEVVYVGALGRLWGPNPERGVFKTEDGGATWQKVLFVDDKTGVIDMTMDPNDPNTLIAALWERKRDEFDRFFQTPSPAPDVYGPAVTHGPGGGVFKTTDGGKTWKKLTDETLKTGLPTVKTGRIGLDWSRKTKGLVVAIIDTEKVGTGEVSPTYLGVVLATADGAVRVEDVTADSPAAKGGLKKGDVIASADGAKVTGDDQFVDLFQAKKPGEQIKLVVKRDGKDVPLDVTLGKREAPPPQPVPPVFGFVIGRGGLTLASVTEGGAAATAGIKAGDTLASLDGRPLKEFADFNAFIGTKKPGDVVKVAVKRGEDTLTFDVKLAPNPRATSTEQSPENFRSPPPNRPYGANLGGQQPNVQGRQGKDGYQTGGVYVSKDHGETWTRVNSINPRPMYFSVVRIDPTDDNTLYVLGIRMAFSTDGGKTFREGRDRGVHADQHALWINPKDGRHLIVGCDGGFYVSHDRGDHWDHLNTLALGQFYHVATDARRPYRVYGGLQDNGSWGGPSDTLRVGSGPLNEDWVFVRGGDGFVCRVDPTDPDLVYSEAQNGVIGRRNFRTGETAAIRPARGPKDEPLRFNWNTPFILSHHNPSIFYCGAQFVFRSVNKGENLKQVSPELTRTKNGSLTAVQESPLNPDVLWAGSDDGFVWVTRDGGANWANVTDHFKSAGLPGPRWVSSIEPSRAKDKPGRCYVVFDAHRSDDDKPYVFVTEDYGATWKSITSNLPAFGSTRVLREDTQNQNLLYLGTEFGAWASANRGASWARLGANLPTVPVHEFAQPPTANELVAGTHGRSVWVLDVTALRQMTPEVLKAKATLFAPSAAVRWKLGVGGESPYSASARKFVGQNPPRGASIDYLLTEKASAVAVKVLDVNGTTVREFRQAPTATGLHRLAWDLSTTVQRPVTGGRAIAGPKVQPGVYRVVLTVDGKEFSRPLAVELDPNAPKDLIATEPEEGEEAKEAATKGDR